MNERTRDGFLNSSISLSSLRNVINKCPILTLLTVSIANIPCWQFDVSRIRNYLTMVFDGCSESSIKQQEDEWVFDNMCEQNKNGTSEKSEPEYLNNHFINDKVNQISLDFTAAKNYCKAQDVTCGDVMFLEKEVNDMMESVKKLHASLSENERIEDFFKFEAKEKPEGGKTVNGDGKDVRVSIEEIEKMEVLLRAKAVEERRAKLCRIQAEEESRNILASLPDVVASNGIKTNFEEFMKLLNDVEETNIDVGVIDLGETAQVSLKNTKDKQEDEKKEKRADGRPKKKKNLKFVEKNIQLAKCGRGTLSLTDEEKLRIENMLAEAEDSTWSTGKEPKVANGRNDLYAIDDETKSVLSKIDKRLEVFTKAHGVDQCMNKSSVLEKLNCEEDVREHCGKANPSRGNPKGNKKRNRLTEIDRLLSDMNSISQEEILPLTTGEIERLVLDARLSLEAGEPATEKSLGMEGAECPSSCRSQHVISELVSKAKLLMPKFKYRFDDS